VFSLFAGHQQNWPENAALLAAKLGYMHYGVIHAVFYN
jgi:hypothetical protein